MTDTGHESSQTLSQNYLQISPKILSSFPKFRPPVDLYMHDRLVFGMRLLHKAGERLGTADMQEVARICAEGDLYLSRNDYRAFAEHMSKKLTLVITESGLVEREVAEIFFIALTDRLREFFGQPLRPALEALCADATILSDYAWSDPCHIGFLLRSLDKHYDLPAHSVNTAFVGLGLYAVNASAPPERLDLHGITLGLLLHDLGMSKVPSFITHKEELLLRHERDSVGQHVDIAMNILDRLRVNNPVVLQCITEHHERFDGSGYPRGLKGKGISLLGRICGLADAFVAMTSQRPHRPAMDAVQAARTLLASKDAFDPALCRKLLELLTQGLPTCPDAGLFCPLPAAGH